MQGMSAAITARAYLPKGHPPRMNPGALRPIWVKKFPMNLYCENATGG